MFAAAELGVFGDSLSAATSDPQRFVLLYEWAQDRIGTLENALTADHQSGLALRPDQNTANAIEVLITSCTSRSSDIEFAAAFAIALKSLDDSLGSIAPSVLAKLTVPNAKGDSCAIARHELFPLAKSSRTSTRNQGGSIRSYARRHQAIRKSGNVDVSSALVETNQTGIALELAVVAGRLLAVPIGNPLEVRIDRSVAFVTASSTESTHEHSPERLVSEALKRAADDRVTVLVLPELCLPEGLLEGSNGLRNQFGGTYPVLVVAGLHHHEFDSGKIRNRSVLVDADGVVLHSHFKLTRVNFSLTGRGAKDIWEGHETGSTITVHPSPLGSIAIPICRDIFAMESKRLIEDSGCTLLLIPSLSPDTKEHELGEDALRGTNHVASLVCNRWFADLPGGLHPTDGESCVLIPGAKLPAAEFARGLPGGTPLEVIW
jgi:hypothetical protein